jgi:hypothetical protein
MRSWIQTILGRLGSSNPVRRSVEIVEWWRCGPGGPWLCRVVRPAVGVSPGRMAPLPAFGLDDGDSDGFRSFSPAA